MYHLLGWREVLFLLFWWQLNPCSPSAKLSPCAQVEHVCHTLAISGIISPVFAACDKGRIRK